jgi:hypothetical protein
MRNRLRKTKAASAVSVALVGMVGTETAIILATP